MIGAWGLNFQNCQHMTTFPSHSFEHYQIIRRCWRFGQRFPVTVDMITTEGEKSVSRICSAKRMRPTRCYGLISHMTGKSNWVCRYVEFKEKRGVAIVAVAIRKSILIEYAIYEGDCIETMEALRAESIDLSIYSPCSEVYITTSKTIVTFPTVATTMRFFLSTTHSSSSRWLRLTRPGRMTAVHCMDITPSGNNGTDFLIDFPGDIIRLHDNHGFKFIARYAISEKEPLAVRNRTMAKNLAHRTVVEDSSVAPVAKRRYTAVFRRKGENKVPINHPVGLLEYSGERVVPCRLAEIPRMDRQSDRKPLFTLDLAANTLAHFGTISISAACCRSSRRVTRRIKYTLPALQLDVIDRVVTLWSNPGGNRHDAVYGGWITRFMARFARGGVGLG